MQNAQPGLLSLKRPKATQDRPRRPHDRLRQTQDAPKTARDLSKTTLLYLIAGGGFLPYWSPLTSTADLGAFDPGTRFISPFDAHVHVYV